MSLNNIMPAWVILGDAIIQKYHEGLISYEDSKEQLIKLGCPPSMIDRLKDDK